MGEIVPNYGRWEGVAEGSFADRGVLACGFKSFLSFSLA